MKFKDIVNRDIVNLENCESEPIHIPGSIQPHGFLIAVRVTDHTIEFCSENIADFIGLRYEQVLGKNLSALFDSKEADNLSTYIETTAPIADAPVQTVINNVSLECLLHLNNDTVIIEFEYSGSGVKDNNLFYSQTKHFINSIENADSLQSLCQQVCDEIRNITAYDRVMVYRFDEQYNGEVYAESRRDDIEPFLGLHYPHTDIPAQARELYLKNLLRLIVDVGYKPVSVYTIDDKPAKNLDMGLAGLRSVSPIHIQYLQNMGVGGTLTISLIHDNKLWGLIACHHYSPKYISNHVRISAKLQGHFLTSQIRVREAGEEYEISKAVDKDMQALLAGNIIKNRESFQSLVEKKELQRICHATGIALVIDDRVYAAGNVPGEDAIKDLAAWLNNQKKQAGYYTDNLSSVYEKGELMNNVAAGILFYSLGNKHNSIIWFRQETTTEVNWAGDPEKAILKDANGLHPRKSFSQWKEIKKGKSKPWLKPEVNAAANFVHALQRQVHLLFITEEEIRYRELSRKLQRANAELENINWISAHDLKEPLRKIQVFASRILQNDEPDPEQIMSSVTRMRDAAERMQSLIGDILSYSRLMHVEDAFDMVVLEDSLKKALREIEEEVNEKKAAINYGPLPTVRGVSFLITQLFLNLIRNSLKFSKENTTSVITITQSPAPIPDPHGGDKKYHEIIVEDNGIGFPEKYNESIFNVFTRLNSREKYTGSGVGLALCKKIMENHDGFIIAKGQEGKGSAFKLYFPVLA